MILRKRPVSPRQKMINLMYVVLMALLAINVATEVLDGFTVMDESLRNSIEGTQKSNSILYGRLQKRLLANRAKVQPWYDKAAYVRMTSDSICELIAELRRAIAQEADGKNGNPERLRNADDLEAATQVMLTNGKGQLLYNAIVKFRNDVIQMNDDPRQREVIMNNLSTEVPPFSGKATWQEYVFESMPAVAAVTLLRKLQSDIRLSEQMVLSSLFGKIDDGDLRVNELKAFVIPSAQTIVKGNSLSARIVMAAVDSTQQQDIYIGGQRVELQDGIYSTTCSQTGQYTLDGYVETTNTEGEVIRRHFSQPYTVVEPTATVSADLTSVLYAGYDNPISISVPGIPLAAVTATASGAAIRQTAQGRYVIRPTKAGEDVTVTVLASNGSSLQQMARHVFKVRRLPEPMPYIEVKDEQGNSNRHRGGAITKGKLTAATRIGAAVDDGILHIPFRVLGFETVFFDGMGNAVPMASEGAEFSQRQKETLQQLGRGRRFYISHVTAIGPDGILRRLDASMEVIIR